MTTIPSMAPLPIEAILSDLKSALPSHRGVVLSADPGAGKTTRVPLALLDAPWIAGKKIVMLEPRRLAAQRSASYMAHLLAQKTGQTVGYRIRGDSRTSSETRIEVVTEGVLTRMVQGDPALPGIGLVIFDEFHERSIHADLGLALTLDVQARLRGDLKILVMSATLDGVGVAALLQDSQVISCEGRSFPVVTHYLQRHPEGLSESLVVSTILRSLKEAPGDVLVFLPGQREIHRLEAKLRDQELPPEILVHTLYGDAPPDRQLSALTSARGGMRKVILSTSIAETSLTIDGVRAVIDSGLARSSRFDPRRGMSGLVTIPVSQAGADQRRGRAGRQQPGVCYRLWTEAQHALLPRFSQPEIIVADLASVALEFARWGDPDGHRLRFLDSPPAAHLSQARARLTELGALDAHGDLTKHGKEISDLPVHPRLAHMLICGKQLGLGSLACDLAALLEERDLLHGERDADVDLFSRWHVLRTGGGPDRFARERARTQATRLRELLRVPDDKPSGDKLGVLLALAYPERVARMRKSGNGRYQLAGGTGAILPRKSLLAREPYLAVGDVDGAGNEVRVYLAAPLDIADITGAFADQLVTSKEVGWDQNRGAIIARRVTRLGAIELSEEPLRLSQEILRDTVLEAIRAGGLDLLQWNKDALSLRTRSEWLRIQGIVGSGWPDLSDQHLLGSLGQWLGPYLHGVTRREQLQKLDLGKVLRALFRSDQLRDLERLAPSYLIAPTGSRIHLEYTPGAQPVLAIRLQEMFGETRTPTIAGGKVRVLLHLLSPAHRPIAVTQDLPSFWENSYPDVRKDMRGRYPKHHWPENPLEARPTHRPKRR